MKKPSKIPNPEEWDFRRVASAQLEIASFYEYARESTKFRVLAYSLLKSKPGEMTFREQIFDLQKSGYRRVVDVLQVDARHLWLDKKRINLLLAVLRLHDISALRFPAPWVGKKVRLSRDPEISRVGIENFWERCARLSRMGVQLSNWSRSEKESYLQRSGNGPFVLSISWQQSTVDGIVANFRKWLVKEAKHHPEMKQRGIHGQASAEWLRDLAALRLFKAGLTFKQTRGFLELYLPAGNLLRSDALKEAGVPPEAIPTAISCNDVKGDQNILPRYQNPSTFSKAITRAKLRLEKIDRLNFEDWKVGFSTIF